MQKIVPIPAKVKAARTDHLCVSFLHTFLGDQPAKLFQLLFKLLTLFWRGPIYAIKDSGGNFVYGITQLVFDLVDHAKPGATVCGIVPDRCPKQPEFRRRIGWKPLTTLGIVPQVIGKASQPTGAAG